jgi:hypothetical protein
MTVSNVVSAILEKVLSVPYPILIACLATLGLILFSNGMFAERLAILDFRNEHRFYLGPLFVFLVLLFFGRLAWTGIDATKTYLSKIKSRKEEVKKSLEQKSNRKKTLRSLTPEEKGYLFPYIHNAQTVVKVGTDDGIMRTLVAKWVT